MAESTTNDLVRLIQPRTFDEALAMAEKLATSQLIPKAYQPKLYADMKPEVRAQAVQKAAADIVIAWDLGANVGFSAMQSLQSIAVISGRPVLYEDAPLAVIRASGTLEKIEEAYDEGTETATCTTWRKGQAEPSIGAFSMADARAATIWEWDEQQKKRVAMTLAERWTYKSFPRDMLKYRARGRSVKPLFADVLKGLGIGEEVRDFQAATPPERDGVIEMEQTAANAYMPRALPDPVAPAAPEAPTSGDPDLTVPLQESVKQAQAAQKGKAAQRVDKILRGGKGPAAPRAASPLSPAGDEPAPDAPVLLCAVCGEILGDAPVLQRGGDWLHAGCVGGLPAEGVPDTPAHDPAVPRRTEFQLHGNLYVTQGMTSEQMAQSFSMTTRLDKAQGKGTSKKILATMLGVPVESPNVSRLNLTEAQGAEFLERMARALKDNPVQQGLGA